MKKGRPAGPETPDGSTADSFLREIAHAPSVRPLPTPGQIVGGKYRIEGLLGRGAMGAVFAAHHELLQQRVALKVMLPEVGAVAQSAARFLNEARAAAKIEGEHVARVFDVGELEDGSPFIALELLEGADLAKVLDYGGPLAIEEAVDFVLQALEALAQAHALGIVHRDVKPANLFLSQRRDGTRILKVLDFGISKGHPAPAATPKDALTSSFAVIGSPRYMAPEQVRSAKRVDPRADIWAIGVVLFELLARRAPFDGETVAEVFVAILERPPRSLREFRPDVPPALEHAVMRCLEKPASKRFNDVGELARALEPFAPARAALSVGRIAQTIAGAAGTTAPDGVSTTLSVAPQTGERGAQPPPITASNPPWSSTSRRPLKRRTRWIAGAGAIGSVLVFLGFVRLWGAEHQPGVAAPSDSQAPSAAAIPVGVSGAAIKRIANPRDGGSTAAKLPITTPTTKRRGSPGRVPNPPNDPFDTPQ